MTSAPSLSVVIPTRDRLDTLRRTLGAVGDQTLATDRFEVIVVDNGSTDGTYDAVRTLAAETSFRMSALQEAAPGPAAARNRGARMAQGDTLMFLGDDTIPADPDLFAVHVSLHAARPEPEYAVLGRVEWHPGRPITPFMRWLDGGPQFGFARLPAGRVEATRAFYTSHVSLKRALFDASGGFDERFPTAAVEDIELGLRLERAGIFLEYHPELVVQHDHPTPITRWMTRARLVGHSAAIYNEIHPEAPLSSFPVPDGLQPTLLAAALPVLAPLSASPMLPERLRGVTWRRAQRGAYTVGYRAEARHRGAPSVGQAGSWFRRRVIRSLVPENIRRRVARSYRPRLLRGSAVACPICGGEFRRFLHHRGQPSVRCPRCGSMERHRLLWLWLRAETRFFDQPLTLLHFAPEWGLKEHLAALGHLDYRTADLDSPLAEEHFDITAIPYADATVDVIFCNHVLEHIPDDRAAMSELHRILRPDGWAVVMTPLSVRDTSTQEGIEDPGARLRVYGQEDHVRLYGQDFYDRLRSVGFEVEVIDYAARLPDEVIGRTRLRRTHPIFEDDMIIVARRPGGSA